MIPQLVIPCQALPNQTFNVSINGQPCTLAIWTRSTGLFMDLYVNGALIVGGVLCLNGVGILQDQYLGFNGELAFFDTQGSSDPTYDGLASRYLLVYLA
jgi:hypothetical protein